jgi:hypothetical protein
MYQMREKWTDERLDDLRDRVDDGFRRVDARFAQIDQRFAQIDQRFAQIDQRFERVDQRFDGMHKLMIQTTLTLVGVMVTGFFGLATIILAHG